MQVKNSILYFPLLVLKILLNLSFNADYKQNKFSKTLPKKDLKFVLNKRDDIVAFKLSFVLLPVKVNLILKNQSRKRYMLIVCSFVRVKIALILLTKSITLYVQTFIVQNKVLSFENFISKYKICLSIFPALNKLF